MRPAQAFRPYVFPAATMASFPCWFKEILKNRLRSIRSLFTVAHPAARLDLELYPYLAQVQVSITSAGDYMTLLSGRAA